MAVWFIFDCCFLLGFFYTKKRMLFVSFDFCCFNPFIQPLYLHLFIVHRSHQRHLSKCIKSCTCMCVINVYNMIYIWIYIQVYVLHVQGRIWVNYLWWNKEMETKFKEYSELFKTINFRISKRTLCNFVRFSKVKNFLRKKLFQSSPKSIQKPK